MYFEIHGLYKLMPNCKYIKVMKKYIDKENILWAQMTPSLNFSSS